MKDWVSWKNEIGKCSMQEIGAPRCKSWHPLRPAMPMPSRTAIVELVRAAQAMNGEYQNGGFSNDTTETFEAAIVKVAKQLEEKR